MPELHVLHPSSNELIRHIWIDFNNKYLVLAPPVKRNEERFQRHITESLGQTFITLGTYLHMQLSVSKKSQNKAAPCHNREV